MTYIVSAAGCKLPVCRDVQDLKIFTNCLSNINEKGVISITGVRDAGGVIGSQSIKQAYSTAKKRINIEEVSNGNQFRK